MRLSYFFILVFSVASLRVSAQQDSSTKVNNGKEILLDTLKPGAEAAQHIGYLPEERGLYPKMTVAHMIEFIGELRGLARAEARRRAAAWLDRLGLTQWAKNKVQDLSKGMQQKVQFATALIHEPALVILDEPWSGLDPINADVLREVVDEIREKGRTVLFSTHQMEQAEKIVDHVCIIAHGKKVLDGSLKDIKQREAAEGVIALGFSAAASPAVDAVLGDRAVVAEKRAPRNGDADCEVKLADGVAAHALLARLVSAGAELRRFELVVPSLHQIFVDRVGATAAVAQRREAS